MSEEVKLLPCPFCGIEFGNKLGLPHGTTIIHPKNDCFLSNTGISTKAWNTRNQPDLVPLDFKLNEIEEIIYAAMKVRKQNNPA